MSGALYSFDNQTVRMIVHSSIGGRRVRVRFSNAYGTSPLAAGAAHLALRDKGPAIIPSSDRTLSFSGKTSFSIPPGADIISDPVDLDVPGLSDLVVSIYIPGAPASPTVHLEGSHTSYISGPGDSTGSVTIPDPLTKQAWYWLSSVDVLEPDEAGLIVAFGDSITDGTRSTLDADASYPGQLARNLAADGNAAGLAIVNQGISGNRLLSDGAGDAGLSRFDRDVLGQPGVKWVIALEGINDIGNCGNAIGNCGARGGGAGPVTADDLIAAYKQIIERAHRGGVVVAGGTLTPFAGAYYYSKDKEATRQAVNRWIRTSKAFDAVVDFDAAIRDPEHPEQIRGAYNDGDHLHPNDAGYKAMADAVDPSIFKSGGGWALLAVSAAAVALMLAGGLMGMRVAFERKMREGSGGGST